MKARGAGARGTEAVRALPADPNPSPPDGIPSRCQPSPTELKNNIDETHLHGDANASRMRDSLLNLKRFLEGEDLKRKIRVAITLLNGFNITL